MLISLGLERPYTPPSAESGPVHLREPLHVPWGETRTNGEEAERNSWRHYDTAVNTQDTAAGHDTPESFVGREARIDNEDETLPPLIPVHEDLNHGVQISCCSLNHSLTYHSQMRQVVPSRSVQHLSPNHKHLKKKDPKKKHPNDQHPYENHPKRKHPNEHRPNGDRLINRMNYWTTV